MVRAYWNIMDENYWVEDNNGIVMGIGKTLKEAVENAEFWGVDCSNLEVEDD